MLTDILAECSLNPWNWIKVKWKERKALWSANLYEKGYANKILIWQIDWMFFRMLLVQQKSGDFCCFLSDWTMGPDSLLWCFCIQDGGMEVAQNSHSRFKIVLLFLLLIMAPKAHGQSGKGCLCQLMPNKVTLIKARDKLSWAIRACTQLDNSVIFSASVPCGTCSKVSNYRTIPVTVMRWTKPPLLSMTMCFAPWQKNPQC